MLREHARAPIVAAILLAAIAGVMTPRDAPDPVVVNEGRCVMEETEMRPRATVSHDRDGSELRDQFVQAFATGFDHSLRQDVRFDALSRARHLDVVLDAGQADVIARELADVTPPAARYFSAHADWRHARVAIATAESLGLGDDETIRSVRSLVNRSAPPDFE